MLGWFAIVQFPDTIRITILPNVPLVVNVEQIMAWAFGGLGIFLAIVVAGKRSNRLHQEKLWQDFEPCARGHYRELLAPAGNSLVLTKRSALISEFLVKMGLGHWADAKKSLGLLQGLP
jgi:hypothetical protein